MESCWRNLGSELDRWADLGVAATLWWRDDDVVMPTPRLVRLLDLTGAAAAPVALAAIARDAGQPLHERIADEPGVSILQHGWNHRNYAATGAKKIELGGERSDREVLDDLRTGWRRLSLLFGGKLLPALVPPWNRIRDSLIADLPAIGYRLLSAFAPRPGRRAAPGLIRINTHVDPIDWPNRGRFVGADQALGQLVGHLEARRRGRVDAAEATGLLTHHLIHDAATWRFLERLADAVQRHAGGRWISLREAQDLS